VTEFRDHLYRRIHAIPSLGHYGHGEQCFPITDAVLVAVRADGYLLVSEAELAMALRAVAHDAKGCNGLHVELEEGIRALAVLVAAQEKGETGS